MADIRDMRRGEHFKDDGRGWDWRGVRVTPYMTQRWLWPWVLEHNTHTHTYV